MFQLAVILVIFFFYFFRRGKIEHILNQKVEDWLICIFTASSIIACLLYNTMEFLNLLRWLYFLL